MTFSYCLQVLFCLLCLSNIKAAEVQNKLTRISIQGNNMTSTNVCSLASTDLYFGLLCDDDFFETYAPQNLASLTQNQNLNATMTIESRNITKPLWSFSEQLIVHSGAEMDQYILLYKYGTTFRTYYYTYNKENGTKPLLTSTHNSRYAEVVEDTTTSKFNVSLHILDFIYLRIFIGRIQQEASTQPRTIFLEHFNGVSKLYTTHPSGTAAVIRVHQSQSYYHYKTAANITTPSQNCATVLTASAAYLAAACPQSNIITIYNNTSYEYICSINVPTSSTFGEEIAIHMHKNSDGAESKIATLFVTGLVSASNLHFVTQVHIIPSLASNAIHCSSINSENDYTVSHTQAAGLTASNLEVGITGSNLLVYLKTPGEIYAADKRALYFTSLNSFYSNSSGSCLHNSYSTSIYNTEPCISCSDVVTSGTLKAFVKQGICCPLSSQHGPQCLQCADYMVSLGQTLPPNSEWTNGEICTSQCIIGYQKFPGSGQCVRSSLLSAMTADSCYTGNTCQKCHVESCYFNGGQCNPGSISRLQAFQSINSQCGADFSFCGIQRQVIDMSSSNLSINLTPFGTNGLKAMKGVLCEWTITMINIPMHLKYSLIAKTQNINGATNSVAAQGFVETSDGSMSLLSNNKKQEFSSTRSSSSVSITVGMLFYTDSNLKMMEITLQNESFSNSSSSSGTSNGILIGIIIGSCLLVVIMMILICWGLKRRRRSRRRAIHSHKQTDNFQLYQATKGEETGKEENQCAVCLEELKVSKIIITKCEHLFHQQCIDLWLNRHSTCPCCRTILKQ